MNTYNVDSEIIRQAFEIDGAALPSSYKNNGVECPYFIVNDDDSTGTDSGYTLASQRDVSKEYILRVVVNMLPEGNAQSLGYDFGTGKYYRFDTSTSVVEYNANLEKIGTITLPSNIGHKNDVCYHDGEFYFPGGYFGADVSTGKKVYKWNPTTNTVGDIDVIGITQPTNGSIRVIMGITEQYIGSEKLYIVTQDNTSSELLHKEDDKMCVYELDLLTHEATLLSESPWDCVYIQGAVSYEGILYVACNTQTTGAASNYKGVTMKVLRTDNWIKIDDLISEDNYEPEGMGIVPSNNGYELEMALGHWATLCTALRFTPPYRID